MKNKLNKNCLYLIGIAVLFLIIALCGYPINKALEVQFDEQVNSSGEAAILIILLLPVYLIMWLVQAVAIAAFELFVVTVPFISGLVILTCALVARFFLSPENGHNIGYRILMGIGYTGAIFTAIPCAAVISCFGFPLGATIAIPCLIFFIKLCSKGLKLTFNEITADKLSFYSDLPHSSFKPAILCDTDFIVHTTNTSADQHYKTYSRPEIKGLLIYNFLTDETGAKLDKCAEMLKNNDSLERFILTYDENGNPDLTVTAVRQKNKKLVGYLFKHE